MENKWHFVIEIFHVKCQLIKCLMETNEAVFTHNTTLVIIKHHDLFVIFIYLNTP